MRGFECPLVLVSLGFAEAEAIRSTGSDLQLLQLLSDADNYQQSSIDDSLHIQSDLYAEEDEA